MRAPWGLGARYRFVALACDFFDSKKVGFYRERLGKQPPKAGAPPPFTVKDFLDYLKMTKALSMMPGSYHVMQIINRMESAGLLWLLGRGRFALGGLQDSYMHVGEHAYRDLFRLVPLLGPQFLHKLCRPCLVHITGTKDGDEASGTGLVIHPSYVLTCRHVVCDMTVHKEQTFQGQERTVEEIHRHPEVDLAVVRVGGAKLSPLAGSVFRSPVIAETVYTIGYPKLPGFREAPVTMQRGEVTNELVTSLGGEKLFLYSAISRPGNSGGPVMSADGYVVGLSSVNATGR